MKRVNLSKVVLSIAICIIMSGMVVVSAYAEYSFKVHNGTDETIKKILVSENKKSWGFFKIGSGIKPGKTVNLVWDPSTDDGPCKNWIKAVFADGSESDPAKFDFCEDDLVLEF